MVTGRVLVTGATGGLGRVLVPALSRRGLQVLATGRRIVPPPDLVGRTVRYVAADLVHDAVEPLVDGADAVVHLAALSSPWGPAQAFEQANVVATRRLLEAARQAGGKAFIHVSTPSIYTEPRDRLGLRDDAPVARRWPNHYARTKYAAEQEVLARPGGLRCVVLRPRAIVSPHDTVLLPRLLRAASGGTLVLPDAGRALVELTDARDVADAVLAALERVGDVHGRAFNISGGMPLPLAQIAALVFDTLGRPLRVRCIGRRSALTLAGLAELAARLRPGCPEPRLTRYSAMAAGWSQTFDLSGAKQALGWTPRRSPREAITWALQHDA